MVVAPAVWLTGNPAPAYNAYLLLSLLLNGLLTYRVLRRKDASTGLSLIGGAMMIWLPISIRQIDTLQLIPVWPMLWVWDAMDRHGKSPGVRQAIELAIAYSFCVYSSVHHALLLTTVMMATSWVLLSSFRTPKFWIASSLSLILAAILSGPIIVPMQQILRQYSFERPTETVRRSSATVEMIVRPPQDSLILPGSGTLPGLSPGWIKLILAGFGAALGIQCRKDRLWILFLILTAAVSATLSLGPNLRLGTFQPWSTMGDWMPGLSHVRNVFRFAYLTQMAIILLAIEGLCRIRTKLRFTINKPWCVRILLHSFAVLALIEVPAPPVIPFKLPDLIQHQDWTEFVKTNCPKGFGILCLPLPSSSKAQDFDSTVRWMYLGSQHGVPMVNGYSGFFPPEHLDLVSEIRREGLSEEVKSKLARLNVYFIVASDDSPDLINEALSSTSDAALTMVFESSSGVCVYRLEAPLLNQTQPHDIQ